MLEQTLAHLPQKFRQSRIPSDVLNEAKKRVLDSLACFYGGYFAKPVRILREILSQQGPGPCSLWGRSRAISFEAATWANGAAVRALDYNDTYLSKEPCHPSDLISSFWAACELTGALHQGRTLLEAIVLGYETVCRLCDAHSLRSRGWDHVNYIGVASAVGCSYIFRLTPAQTAHAISLTIVANNALRQTRVGTISDWKAACAAYAARAGLVAARLAQNGFTGPENIFSGRHGFFNQVSGGFALEPFSWGKKWKIMETHTKFYPAEHHAQSAIEAAVELSSVVRSQTIQKIGIDSFEASVQIIGSEKEKWRPETRETADHSLPYLVCAALQQGDINLKQYETRLFLKPVVRNLMKKTVVKSLPRYNALYPQALPARLTIFLKGGGKISKEVLRPRGYAGRPMTVEEVRRKFDRLSNLCLSIGNRQSLIEKIMNLERCKDLKALSRYMTVR